MRAFLNEEAEAQVPRTAGRATPGPGPLPSQLVPAQGLPLISASLHQGLGNEEQLPRWGWSQIAIRMFSKPPHMYLQHSLGPLNTWTIPPHLPVWWLPGICGLSWSSGSLETRSIEEPVQGSPERQPPPHSLWCSHPGRACSGSQMGHRAGWQCSLPGPRCSPSPRCIRQLPPPLSPPHPPAFSTVT